MFDTNIHAWTESHKSEWVCYSSRFHLLDIFLKKDFFPKKAIKKNHQNQTWNQQTLVTTVRYLQKYFVSMKRVSSSYTILTLAGFPVHWSDNKSQMSVAKSLFSSTFISSLLSQEMDLSTSIIEEQKIYQIKSELCNMICV